ncbi:MAG: 2-amino-4-hydroxy-6-hydroxymethyldihydropteridine diphosphokinase [Anaerolineales bacterium]
MRHLVYLALGTNLGNRLSNLRMAIHSLPPQVQVVAESRVYETPPWGYTDQPPFLNMAIRAETDLPPAALLAYLKHIETQMGREKSMRWGPRLIDLDILFYDDLTLESPGLVIPHPHLHERGFVLAPLADLAPELEHPSLRRRIRDLLAAVDLSGIKPLA